MLALVVVSLSVTSTASAELRPIPSLRLASGVGSIDLAPDRQPGFVGHLDVGLTLVTYRSAADSVPLMSMIADAIVPPGTTSSSRAGLVARAGIGYDRAGPRGDAARNLSVSAEVGYGYSILQATVGLAYLTGRVAGDRARGLRASLHVGFEYGVVFLEVAGDTWRIDGPNRHDVVVLLGVDVLAFGWLMGIGTH